MTRDVPLESLIKACATAAKDGERLRFNVSYVQRVLNATRTDASTALNRETLRFLRQLLYAWLDAPDYEARALIRRTLNEHLAREDMQVAA